MGKNNNNSKKIWIRLLRKTLVLHKKNDFTTKTSVSSSDINTLEDKLSFKLPNWYKNFLLSTGHLINLLNKTECSFSLLGIKEVEYFNKDFAGSDYFLSRGFTQIASAKDIIFLIFGNDKKIYSYQNDKITIAFDSIAEFLKHMYEKENENIVTKRQSNSSKTIQLIKSFFTNISAQITTDKYLIIFVVFFFSILGTIILQESYIQYWFIISLTRVILLIISFFLCILVSIIIIKRISSRILLSRFKKSIYIGCFTIFIIIIIIIIIALSYPTMIDLKSGVYFYEGKITIERMSEENIKRGAINYKHKVNFRHLNENIVLEITEDQFDYLIYVADCSCKSDPNNLKKIICDSCKQNSRVEYLYGSRKLIEVR